MRTTNYAARRLAILAIALMGVAGLIAPLPSGNAARRAAATKAVPPSAPMADLAITSLKAPGRVLANSSLTYTIALVNFGPDAADTVMVGDNLPAGLSFVSCQATAGGVCSSGAGSNRTVTFTSLAPGTSALITLVASVDCSVVDGMALSNTALVTSLTADPNSNNNSATAVTAVANPTWLSPSSQPFAANGGNDIINVTRPSGCGWSAASNVGWVTFPNGNSGSGSATLTYAVGMNPNAGARSGAITIAEKTFTVQQGAAFFDVPAPNGPDPGHPFYSFIGKLSALGITSGCGAGNFCPEANVTREQMAAFIIKAKGIFNPPTNVPQRFLDVPKFLNNDPNQPNPFYGFIDQMGALGITSGCGGGNYCPQANVTREQMAAFIIKALGIFNPPPPAQPRFLDVPADNQFYAFIEQMAVRGITVGCGGGNYCPKDNVTRGQMAVFLVKAFGTPNQPPAVSAGSDQAISLPTNSVNLTGQAKDDGLPAGSTLAVTWSKLSGPGTVTFGNANAAVTTASFSAAGVYVLRLQANDSQLSGSDDVTITVNANQPNQPPSVNAGPDQTITLPGAATLNGTVTDDGLPVGGALTISWVQVSGPGTVLFSNASGATTTAIFSVAGSYVLRLLANDSQLASADEVVVTVNADPTPPPPDPSLIAPPIDPTVVTTIGEATKFLYTGPNPIQTGVAPGTISLVRAAVLRGRVLNPDGTPLAKVKITVLNHPEFGQTLSRADGKFDLAVNGGGLLTVNYEKTGFLPAQRKMDVPWQDYCLYPDVVIMGYDGQVTTIDLSANIPIQVAQGSAMSDSDGSRRAVLLFRQGTSATMVLPNGSTQPLTTLHVRATEYTVGPMGPTAMPAELPAISGYTYAVEFSADEAVAAGAKSITFSQPVINYLENFLNFPVGTNVPSGVYDRGSGIWVPAPSGRVVKILSISNGQANLDVQGSGQPASDADYAALGITVAERQQMATLYAVGQTLWRVPLTQFTDPDYNYPSAPNGSTANTQPANGDNKDPCQKQQSSSIIECQGQTLGEAVNLVGTPFSLNYRSDRVPGRTSAYSLTIPVSGASVPNNLKRIELETLIAGRSFKQTFSAAPSQSTTFAWDGLDAYGRPLQGRQLATVRVGYVYNAVYNATPSFGNYGDGTVLSINSRREAILWQEQRLGIGIFDLRGIGLGGWSLSPHHVYDPVGQVVYLGDGRQRRAASVQGISTFAGGGAPPDGVGDGLPATQAQLSLGFNGGIAAAPDGSLFIADSGHHRIRKVATSGIITTVAGTGAAGYNGDGIQATQAQLNQPSGFTLAPDGSLYLADAVNNRVRKVAPNGVITTVAGNGTEGFSGDGGQATQAQLSQPHALALGPEGNLYLLDSGNVAVRRVAPDGIITTIVRGNPARPIGRGPAITVPNSVMVGPDGLLYIADAGGVLRVNADKTETLIAGGGSPPDGLGDGLPATQAQLNPSALAFGRDGTLYIAEGLRIRAVGPDGIINTIAGHGSFGFSGDGGPAPQAEFRGAQDLALGQGGGLYIMDSGNNRIRKVTPPLPGFSATDLAIPSADGNELYQFNSVGRHLRTINTLTGATRYTFTYDSAGRLTQVTDGDGNMTTIERNANGDPTAIVGPFGQRTMLTLNANGFLSSIADPASQTYQFAYTANGLLTSLTNPRGQTSNFLYDATGRLIKDTDAATGFKALARTEQSQQYSVALSTALGRTDTYQVQTLSTGDKKNLDTDPAGLQTQGLRRTNGTNTTTAPDGRVTTLAQSGDPRWGMQAPLAANATISTPGGLNLARTFGRTVVLSNSTDPLSLVTQTGTLTINGRTYTSVFTAATRTFNDTTPLGRQATTTIDPQGRPTARQFANLNPRNFTYDARGRLSTAVFGGGTEARTASFSYNGNGFLASITDPLNRVTSFTYDAAGRITQQTAPDGRVIGFGYDANGNLISVTPPGRPAHTFAYTPVDLVATYTPPAVPGTGPTQYAYNLDRQLTTITRPDNLTLNFAYDTAGRLSTLTVPTGQYSYTYHATTGHLTSITAPGGGTLTYTYDGALRISTAWGGTITGNVSRTFDNNFRITSQSINGGNTISFTYDNDSRLTGAGSLTITRQAQNGLITGTTLNQLTDTRGYNNFGEITSYSAVFNSTGRYSATYTRDKLAHITQKTETIGGVTNVYDYTYDLAGRLTQVKKDNVTISTYTYDSNDNRASLTTPGGTVNGTYDNQDRLTQYGTAVYAYTANGELSSKTVGAQATTHQYDVLGNLRHVTLPDNTQIDYVIDGRNRRIGKKVNGTLAQGFLYQNQLKPVAELDGSNNLVSRFVYGPRRNVPDYLIKSGATYRIITDQLGSVRLVVDVSTGNIAQRIDYDEFGVVLMDTNPGFQPFGFAGGLYDSQTKLVRFGARDYDAEIGRWTAKDPILFAGSDSNLYAYGLADPVNHLDPSGLLNTSGSGGDMGGTVFDINFYGDVDPGGGIDPYQIPLSPETAEAERVLFEAVDDPCNPVVIMTFIPNPFSGNDPFTFLLIPPFSGPTPEEIEEEERQEEIRREMERVMEETRRQMEEMTKRMREQAMMDASRALDVLMMERIARGQH